MGKVTNEVFYFHFFIISFPHKKSGKKVFLERRSAIENSRGSVSMEVNIWGWLNI